MIKEKLKLPAELAPPRVLEQANEILGLKGEGALPAQATLALKTIEDNQKAKAELLRKQAEGEGGGTHVIVQPPPLFVTCLPSSVATNPGC